jgi:RHS repeat-associated protein
MGPYGDNFTETLSTLDFTGFAGGFWDSENNNGEHFGAREYENTHGSWLSPDPAGMAAVDISNPQSWNRYAYVLDNPVSYADPTGLFRVGPLAYAGYYTFGCDDMNGGGLLNNCDFLNPFSGMQGILLSQLSDPMLAEWSGLGPSYLCGGESLGLPCGLPSQGISVWDILGVSPPGANCMPICDAQAANNGQNPGPNFEANQQCQSSFLNATYGAGAQPFVSHFSLFNTFSKQGGATTALLEFGKITFGGLALRAGATAGEVSGAFLIPTGLATLYDVQAGYVCRNVSGATNTF